MHCRQTAKAAGRAKIGHGEGGAGVVLALGGDAVVAGNVVELVTGDQDLGHGRAGGELRGGVGFPLLHGAPIAVRGAEAGKPDLLACPGQRAGVGAGVGQLDADAVGVGPAVARASAGILPARNASVAAGAVERAALDDGAIALDDQVRAGPFGGGRSPEVDARSAGGPGGEVDD